MTHRSSLDAVDLTVRDPVLLRRRFDEIVGYIATVEGSVPQNVADITALLPDLDELDRRFLEVWSSHEQAHAAIFSALRAELGPVPGRHEGRPDAGTAPAGAARPSFRVAGAAARVPWVQDVVKLVYLARGAMHEHLTYDCYRHLGAQLSGLGRARAGHHRLRPDPTPGGGPPRLLPAGRLHPPRSAVAGPAGVGPVDHRSARTPPSVPARAGRGPGGPGLRRPRR